MENKRVWVFKLCWLVLGVVILLLPFMFVASTKPAPASLPKVNWNYHSIMPKEHLLNKAAQEAFNKLAEFTGGRFTITLYPAGGLGFKGSEIWDAIGKGLVPMGEMWSMHVAGKYPFCTILELPGLYDRTNIELSESLIAELWDDLTKPFWADNLYALNLNVLAAGQGLSVNKPLNLAEPKAILKGLKIRVAGPPSAWAVEVLGGKPTYTDWGEIYLAVQRGVVDGMDIAPGGTMIAMKFYEVAKMGVFSDSKNYVPFETAVTSYFVVANKKELEALPVEWQKKLKEVMREAQAFIIRKRPEEESLGAKRCVVEHGLVPVEVPAETLAYIRTEGAKYTEKWKAKAGPLGEKLHNKALGVIKK